MTFLFLVKLTKNIFYILEQCKVVVVLIPRNYTLSDIVEEKCIPLQWFQCGMNFTLDWPAEFASQALRWYGHHRSWIRESRWLHHRHLAYTTTKLKERELCSYRESFLLSIREDSFTHDLRDSFTRSKDKKLLVSREFLSLWFSDFHWIMTHHLTILGSLKFTE